MTPKELVAATYNAAADRDGEAALAFRERFARRAVEMARPAPGEMVLDVCCGSGPASLAAARAVSPGGRVIGVDLAQGAVEQARARAAAAEIRNVEFRVADFDKVYFRDGSFNAVVCVFGVFFFEDMAGAVKKMWRYVRPGGRLAVTTWAAGLFEPAHTRFWDAIRRVRPDLLKTSHTRDRLKTADEMRALLRAAGIAEVQIESEDYAHPIAGASDWWTIVMGTGYRGTIDQLTAGERELVRLEAGDAGVAALPASVLYATARKGL